MKDAYYFPHDMNARTDPKLSALIGDYGPSGYGIYWIFIEMLHEDSQAKLPNKDYIYKSISTQSGADYELVREIIQACIDKYDLFLEDNDGNIYSQRVLSNLSKREEIKEKRRKAGKASGKARKKQTNDEQNGANVQQNANDEVVLDNREEKAFAAICQYWNISEMNNFRQVAEVKNCMKVLKHRNRLDYFIKQFKSYMKLIDEYQGKKFKKNLRNYIGTSDEMYENGGWNEMDFSEKLNELEKGKQLKAER